MGNFAFWPVVTALLACFVVAWPVMGVLAVASSVTAYVAAGRWAQR